MSIKFTHLISSSLYGGPQEPSHKTFVKRVDNKSTCSYEMVDTNNWKKVELLAQNYYQTMDQLDNDDNNSTCSYEMID